MAARLALRGGSIMPKPYLLTADPSERLVYRAIVERMERLRSEELKALATLTANYTARAMGGGRRK